MNLGIVGGGRAAWAYGSALRSAGWSLAGVWLRDSSTSGLAQLLATRRASLADLARSSDIILIAVSDSAIAEVFERMRGDLSADSPIFHASGAMTSEIFTNQSRGFSLHPLRALPPVGTPIDLRETLFVFEGASAARAVAESIANAVGGRFTEIARQNKMLYHAGAVFGSNYVAALLETARTLIREAGIHDASRKDLAELASSAIDNWFRNEGAAAFTGPVVRGDSALVARHLAALADSPARQEIYRLLALELCDMVGREKPGIAELRTALEK